MTAETNGERDTVTGFVSSGFRATSAPGQTDCRKGAAVPVVASCTQTDTREAPSALLRRPSWWSSAACASYCAAGPGGRRTGRGERGAGTRPCVAAVRGVLAVVTVRRIGTFA